MSIPDTHIVELRFKIDGDAPQKYIDEWLKLKTICENGKNKELVDEWLSNCKIQSVRNMPYLDRCEGGIGGNNNIINKQLRFRKKQIYSISIDNDIVIENIISSEQEKWTLEELDDLIRAFRRMANNYVGAECINGCIEMVNINSLYDNYLDNKNDYS